MKGYTPGLFDRLLGAPQRGSTGAPGTSLARQLPQRLTIEELKEAVARDLEALLNTRASLAEETLKDFPLCSRSLVAYGLRDFADRCLSSPLERAAICASIEKTIASHEPRLRKASASFVQGRGAVNRLNFSITALLVASMSEEPVSFDAVLTSSNLQYSVSRGGKGPRPVPAGG